MRKETDHSGSLIETALWWTAKAEAGRSLAKLQ